MDHEKHNLLFRFVPTMRCNLHCSYCFVPQADKRSKQTLFQHHAPGSWVAAMRNFSAYDVEFYLWGGEPFLLRKTFEMVKGFVALDCVTWARIDTNLCFARDIIKRCESPKVKILGSWHTETFGYQEIMKRAALLHERKMLGMVNLVAGDATLHFVGEMGTTVEELVRRFYDAGIFLNVAADFLKGNDPAYRSFITRYMTEDDWEHIHGERPCTGVECRAGESFFTVNPDGSIETCNAAGPVGDFFQGTLNRNVARCPQAACHSIIAYPFRTDNHLESRRHLEAYIERSLRHRRATGVLV